MASNEMNELMAIQRAFNQFDGKSETKELRKELTETIRKVVEQYGFVRKDKNGVVELKLHPEPTLSPEISIGITTDRKFWVCDDSLWRTIEGLHEAEQEKVEYRRRYAAGDY